MKILLLTTALVFVGSNAFAATSEFTCPEGSATTLHCFTCGSNCTMTLDTATGHAVVSGTGDMEGNVGNAEANVNAWGIYKNSFKSVEIKEGITSVGKGAFQGTAVESVIIPNTVTTIGGSAFSRVTNLEKIVIPDSVTKIGSYAFDWIADLKELVIPDSVTSIAGNTFVESTLKYVLCSGGGDTSKCDALLAQTGKNIQSISRPNYKLDENGNIVERYQYDENGNRTGYTSDGRVNKYDTEGHLISSTKSNADGSTSIYNKDGELVGIKGKKIYTVEEAEAVTAHGDKFHVSLTYK